MEMNNNEGMYTVDVRIREVDRRVFLEEEAEALARLAAEIWTEHYTPIIGAEQVAYMLENYQSAARIASDIQDEGYHYYIAEDLDAGKPVGYSAMYLTDDCMFLSKLYVLRDYRGQGIARRFFDLLISMCHTAGKDKIELHVNIHNASSIAVYEKMGFVTTGDLQTDIGGGFIMDDHVMVYTIAK